MYKNPKVKKTIQLLLIILLLINTYINAQDNEFEITIPKPKKDSNESTEAPLFNTNALKTNNQSLDNEPNWENNPFFKKSPEIQQKKKTETTPKVEDMTLFEYKISAIWEINNNYKALISGHIVKTGDTINEITIKKITKDSIVVERKKRTKVFRLGLTFYDFQI